MNKADLITSLKNETDLSKTEAEFKSGINIFSNLNRAIFKFVADTRKVSFRYSFLCGMASDKVDAVILPRRIKIGIPDLLVGLSRRGSKSEVGS
jgi:hypothetical protein